MNTTSTPKEYNEEDLAKIFGEALTGLLFRVGEFARSKQVNIFLVGGAVRDFLLGAYSDDIDFVLEQDGIGFCRALKDEWGRLFPTLPLPGKPVTFSKYGTAKLLFKEEIAPGIDSLDFSTMRRESYPQPGGSPLIERGDLTSDLARRDFSMNALALQFCGGRGLRLIDHFSGVRALQDCEIHVLHERSFLDDPARLIRACRFLSRFSFHFGDVTKILFEKAVEARYLQTLPRGRLFDEFRKALCEREPFAVLATLHGFGLLEQIHPEILFEPSNFASALLGASLGRHSSDREQVVETQRSEKDYWKHILRELFRGVSLHRYEEILEEFGVKPRERESFLCISN